LKVTPLTKNFKRLVSNVISKFKFTSAAPGVGIPGTRVSLRGWRFVSRSGLVGVDVVSGSRAGAPEYLRIAEFMPPAKPVGPILGFARIQ